MPLAVMPGRCGRGLPRHDGLRRDGEAAIRISAGRIVCQRARRAPDGPASRLDAAHGQHVRHGLLPARDGLFGGFTTFSTFSLDTFLLYRSGDASLAALNIALNMVLCLCAVWGGYALPPPRPERPTAPS